MNHYVSRSLFILLLSATGCGDGDSSRNNGATNDGTTNNGGSNNANGGPTNNASSNNAGSNNLPANNGAPNNGSNDTSSNNSTNNGVEDVGCALPEPFDAGATYATEVRVAPGESLGGALSAATPGTRIVLAAGEHAGGVFASDVQGTADAPIALVGEDGAVITGGTTGIQLSDPAYLVIENIRIEGASANGLNIDDGGDYATPARHVVLRDLEVVDIGDGGNQDCIKLSGLDHFTIEGVTVSSCSGQGIDMVGCHEGVITNNTIHDTPGAGIQAKGGTADVMIHANRFERVDGRGVNAGGSTGLEFFRPIDAPHEGARIEVYSNVFIDVGASSGAPIAYVGCDACSFTNNTVVRPLTWVARILQETTDARFVPSRDGVFANNVVVFDSSVLRTFVNVGPSTAPETFSFRNNLWWDLADPGFGGPTWGDGIPAEQGGAVADPGFDPDGVDFTITAGSPAAGVGVDAPEVPDAAGRCFAEPPAAGAYEVP